MKIEELISLKKKIELSENILTEYVGSKPKNTYQKVAAFKHYEPEPEPTQYAKLKVKPPEKSLGPGVHGPLPPVLVTRRKKIDKIVDKGGAGTTVKKKKIIPSRFRPKLLTVPKKQLGLKGRHPELYTPPKKIGSGKKQIGLVGRHPELYTPPKKIAGSKKQIGLVGRHPELYTPPKKIGSGKKQIGLVGRHPELPPPVTDKKTQNKIKQTSKTATISAREKAIALGQRNTALDDKRVKDITGKLKKLLDKPNLEQLKAIKNQIRLVRNPKRRAMLQKRLLRIQNVHYSGTQYYQTKPIEVKPVEVKPVEVKPVEVKPVEVKPVEIKSKADVPKSGESIKKFAKRLGFTSVAELEVAQKNLKGGGKIGTDPKTGNKYVLKGVKYINATNWKASIPYQTLQLQSKLDTLKSGTRAHIRLTAELKTLNGLNPANKAGSVTEIDTRRVVKLTRKDIAIANKGEVRIDKKTGKRFIHKPIIDPNTRYVDGRWKMPRYVRTGAGGVRAAGLGIVGAFLWVGANALAHSQWIKQTTEEQDNLPGLKKERDELFSKTEQKGEGLYKQYQDETITEQEYLEQFAILEQNYHTEADKLISPLKYLSPYQFYGGNYATPAGEEAFSPAMLQPNNISTTLGTDKPKKRKLLQDSFTNMAFKDMDDKIEYSDELVTNNIVTMMGPDGVTHRVTTDRGERFFDLYNQPGTVIQIIPKFEVVDGKQTKIPNEELGPGVTTFIMAGERTTPSGVYHDVSLEEKEGGTKKNPDGTVMTITYEERGKTITKNMYIPMKVELNHYKMTGEMPPPDWYITEEDKKDIELGKKGQDAMQVAADYTLIPGVKMIQGAVDGLKNYYWYPGKGLVTSATNIWKWFTGETIGDAPETEVAKTKHQDLPKEEQEKYETQIVTNVNGMLDTKGAPTTTENYETVLKELADRYGMDVELIKTLARTESGVYICRKERCTTRVRGENKTVGKGELTFYDMRGDTTHGRAGSFGMMHVRSGATEGAIASVEAWNEAFPPERDEDKITWEDISTNAYLAATIGTWYFSDLYNKHGGKEGDKKALEAGRQKDSSWYKAYREYTGRGTRAESNAQNYLSNLNDYRKSLQQARQKKESKDYTIKNIITEKGNKRVKDNDIFNDFSLSP